MSHSVYLYQSVSLSPSSQSVPSSSPHSLLTFPSIALDIQHFLKPFTVTSGEMHCHSLMIYTDQQYIVISWSINLSPLRFTISSTDGFSGVKIFNTCVLDFCIMYDQSQFMAVFTVFNLWISPGFIFESCS